MTNLNVRTSFLSLLAIMLLFAGCLRDTPPVPDNYQAYPLSITAGELPNGSFRVRWNAIKSVDFIEYQVIRNVGDSVPYIPNNQVPLNSININLEIIKRISDADSTFFIDEVTIPTTKTYLRVFAVLKNRNLSSRNVEMPVKANVKEIQAFTATDMLFVPEEKRLVFISQAQGQLGVYNTDVNTLATSLSFNTFFQATAEISYGRFNNATEIYLPNSSQLVVKNFTNLNSSSVFFTSSNTESVLFDKDNNLLLTVGSFPTTLRSFSRINSGISSISFASFSTLTNQNAYVFRTANFNREAIAVSITGGNSNVIWFTYNTSGQQITPLKNLTTSLPMTKRPFVVAPDNQVFITGNKGIIVNRNIVLSDSLKTRTAATRYIDMIFSDDKTRLLALRSGASSVDEKRVDVYKYPSFEFERSIVFRSNPTRFFQDGTSLLLVGVSPNNLKSIMVERVAF